MKCSIFIAPSVDGYIATKDGGVHWLETVGKPLLAIEKNSANMKYFNECMHNYMKNIDCMVIGRNLMQVLSDFNLTPQQWPYGETRIIVLTQSIQVVPKNLVERVELYAKSISSLIQTLEEEGYKHIYVDGGKTITSFLNLELINEMTLTLAPVLLGSGIPLFSQLSQHVILENAQAIAFENNFIELKYTLKYLDGKKS